MSDMNKQEMTEKVKTGKGFIAALDQSGGSTPKALRLYGVEESEYSNDEEMFDIIHAMRTRIIKSPSFTGERVLGAILFENTMDRTIDDLSTAEYLWTQKNVVPFLKVDKGLADVENDVQLMKPIPGLKELLDRASSNGVFGTKMRSVIKGANPEGIKAVVEQQFAVAKEIIAAGLVPIIEPEVDITISDKAEAENLLKEQIALQIEAFPSDVTIMLKLSLPTEENLYQDFVNNPQVLRVVALSGGYSRDEANQKLSANKGVIASFSRALTESLSAKQADADFDTALDTTIQGIYDASIT